MEKELIAAKSTKRKVNQITQEEKEIYKQISNKINYSFKEYYQSLLNMHKGDFEEFLNKLSQKLPITFRINKLKYYIMLY